MQKKYTDEQLILAVKECKSLQQVLDKLNLIGGHGRMRDKINRMNLDISHWEYQMKSYSRLEPLENILIENSTATSFNLRKRLLNNNLLNYKCYICGIKDWLGQHLSLQLDHINGVRTDNRIDNLRLLCPNCHSQTETYSGKNIKGIKFKKDYQYVQKKCKKCNVPLSYSSKNTRGFCKSCRKNKYNGKLTKKQVLDIKNKFTIYKNKKQIIDEYDISYKTLNRLLDINIEDVLIE